MLLELHVHSSDSWEYHGQKANKWIIKQINQEFWLESQMTRLKLYNSDTLCEELPVWRSSNAGKGGIKRRCRWSEQGGASSSCGEYIVRISEGLG